MPKTLIRRGITPWDKVINFIGMNKITNILFTLAFTSGCFGLWLMLGLFQSIYPLHLTGNFPNSTRFLLANKFLFLMVPIPFWLFSIFVAFKKQPTTEANLLHIGILAVAFTLLFFLVVIVVFLPWIPVLELSQ